MSEHIVHTAILEDSFAICLTLPNVSEEFKNVMREHAKFAQLGCITVAGDQFSTRLLTEYREKWEERDESLLSRLAFVLGWISHRACDRTMKPIWVEPPMKIGSDVDPTISPSECSVYHEGYMFNKYYSDDKTFEYGIFSERMRELPGFEQMDSEAMREFVQQGFGSNYMAIQTIPEDAADQEWFEGICMRAQKFYVDVNRYRRSAGCPKPELTEGFITGINWYDETDAIVRLANNLRWNRAEKTLDLEVVLKEEPAGYYGRALKLSIGYIMAADEFFQNPDMSVAELKERLDIGKLDPADRVYRRSQI